ncbi:hypothetical protein [Pseudonocardia hydrocarbonoxydans]|uniref:HNH endonuclease n=1 Tax=Pseudonocardia hydrocarbonoxydans TaxID=76726 RepID=A0A4Y3WR63_9PSEU|nr:hypothetical protein [Pseudonocardia hydrocarbonoxydans]GEC20988.1 hypothetical protein PHY01_32710 [Pseudonocardia hydrocarbonoxydans]
MSTTTPKARPAPLPTCNVPGCPRTGRVRGLCDPHWATHRGLADPKDTP